MSKTKEKKLKRLRKAHIWPSVVFLILVVLLSVVAFMSFLVSSMTDMALERFTQICSEAENISRIIGSENNIAELSEEKLMSVSGFTDGLYVLDENGSIIAGFGEKSYMEDKPLKYTDPLTDKDYTLYVDTAYEDNIMQVDGTLDLSGLLNEKSAAKYASWLRNDIPDLNAPVFEARFWIKNAASDNCSTMVKCSVPLYYRDFIRSAGMAVMAFVIMLLPIVFFFINIIISVHGQRRLTKLLYTDTVTAGCSYVYFDHTVDKLLEKPKKLYAITDVTVMKYRSYCNYHGVAAGEELLENVDRQLHTYLTKKEICAHSGKASFALLLNCPDKETAEARMNKMMKDLTLKFGHGGIVFHAGIYFSEPARPRAITDASDCFNRAGAARATLTDENIAAVAVYNDKLLEEQLWEHHVEEKMQSALDKEEFQVYIQPKYDPVTEKLAGAEALVRWVSEEEGFVPPGKFIPIFEKNGFITKLDDYMLSHVAKLQSEWIAEGKSVVPISVNVSRAHFANPDLAKHICGLVDKYEVPHELIEIELTESAFFDDKEALLRTVHSLGDMGFEISMDDFGAGYSSLNSLKDLPLDVLKLDADFFRGEDSENRGEIVVSQAIALAKKLNMRIVAEGVEKKEQVDFLAGQGCDMIQGFYFAKPMPAADYAQGLETAV